MKPILYLGLILLLVSCHKNELEGSVLQQTGRYKVTAGIDNEKDTKTDINNATIKWKEDDAITIAQVGANNTFNKLYTFNIDNASISDDGKSADFYGPELLYGNKYIAINGGCEIFDDSRGEYKGKLCHWFDHDNQKSDNDASHINDKWFMTSSAFEIQNNQSVKLKFTNHQSILKLNLKMKYQTDGEYQIKRVSFKVPVPALSHGVLINLDDELTAYSGSLERNLEFANNPIVSSSKDYTALIPIWWDREINEVNEDFIVTIKTVDNKTSSISIKGRPLSNGKLYTRDLLFDTPTDKVARDREIVMMLYNTTDGENWTYNTNWGSDKPLDQWYGIGTTDGRISALMLDNNNLNGAIPTEICDLDKLGILRFSENRGLSGAIPDEIYKLSNLSEISLSDCGLSGSIPSRIGELKKLNYLYLGSNQLTGDIPESLTQLHQLRYIILASNNLMGTIPNNIGDLSELRTLNLYNNLLSGEIPVSIGNLKKLENINLSQCNLTGSVPKEFQNIPNWEKLQITTTILPQKNGNLSMPDLISLSESNVKFNKLLSRKSIDIVITGSEWSYILDPSATWCKAEMNGYQLIVLADPNGDGVNRTANITVKSGVASSVLTVTQLATDDYVDGMVVKLAESTKGNGINIVLLGDGFTFSDLSLGGKYETTMQKCADAILNVEPFITYKEYFNIYTVISESQESGVSYFGNKVNTKYQMLIQGLVSSDYNACLKAVKTIPNLGDVNNVTTVLIGNSTHRGGTANISVEGYSLTMCSGNWESLLGTMHHEVCGHGFGRLADEYIVYDFEISQTKKESLRGYQAKDMYLNVDLTSDIKQSIWKEFSGLDKYSMVGAYEGGYLYKFGVWRAEETSCMESNIPYFNAPSRLAIVKRIKKIAGETFSWGEFLQKDKIVYPQTTKPLSQYPYKHVPPVVTE